MPLVPSVVGAVLVPWAIAALVASSSTVAASAGGAAPQVQPPARAPWACRLIAPATVRRLVEKAFERSETIRRQCQELGVARAVVVLEWGVVDSQSHARTVMETRDGVVVASVKVPPVGDNIVLMAHELQHVIEQTQGLDFAAQARLAGSGVWRSPGGYETQAAIDVSRQVADELRAYSRTVRRSRTDSERAD